MDKEEIQKAIIQSLGEGEAFVGTMDGCHFEAIVVSSLFEGLSLVKQHQLVMKALKDQFDDESLHALKLKTFTPSRWDEVKDLYRV